MQTRMDSPPRFTLARNPFLGELGDAECEARAVSEAFLASIEAGKNTYVYDAHTYHTKVPPAGIALILEHYTREGDVVLDPFCGSGMTGVAALQTRRKPVLADLSPAATFIAYNLMTPVEPAAYLSAVRALRSAGSELEDWLYGTICPKCGASTTSRYTVWSYRVVCPHCGDDFRLWEHVRDERAYVRESKIRSTFHCPSCSAKLRKRGLRRTVREAVVIGTDHCMDGLQETKSEPTVQDLEHLSAISYESIPSELWYPSVSFPDGVNTRQAVAAGIVTVRDAYEPRALWAMSFLWDRARRWPDRDIRAKLLFTLTSLYQRVTRFSEFRFWGGSGNIANYYVPSIINEQNVFQTFERKANTIALYFREARDFGDEFRISTQSACSLDQIPTETIDFAFTDPPFGANINYSEMNLLWESWLGVRTDPQEEAIVNKVQGKSPTDYSALLTRAFSEVRRVLKPNAWFVVMFHNSSARIWQALQCAIVTAGFEVIGTQTFDKRHGTFKDFVSENAVGFNVVLHCRKRGRVSVRAEGANKNGRRPGALVQARAFVRDRLAIGRDYTVHYEHVERDDEFDYRRLYAEWVAEELTRGTVSISFAGFRDLVDKVREDMATDADGEGGNRSA